MQILPSTDLSRVFLRLTRFSAAQLDPPLDSMMSNICEYMWSDNCGPKMMKGVKRVTLDGDQIINLNETMRSTKEVFVVDTYEVIIED